MNMSCFYISFSNETHDCAGILTAAANAAEHDVKMARMKTDAAVNGEIDR